MAWFLAAAKKALLQAKTVIAGTSNVSVSPDSGYDGLSSVTVQPTPSESKEVTAGTAQSTVTPTSGKLLSSVVVNPTPSQEKTVTSSRTAQTVTPDSGKLLSKVTINALVPSGTFTANTKNSALDMGATNNYRYVNTSGIANSNSGTYTFASGDTGGTKDLGETNTYRYVNATNVYNKGKADGSGTIVGIGSWIGGGWETGTKSISCQVGDVFIIQSSNYSDTTVSGGTDVTTTVKNLVTALIEETSGSSWKAWKATSTSFSITKSAASTGLRLIIQFRGLNI